MRLKHAFFSLTVIVIMACSSKNDGKAMEETPVQFPKLGISLKIPEGFEALSPEELQSAELLGATVVPVEPFIVLPRHGFRDTSGKGIIVISELRFTEPDKAEIYPMSNLYKYQKNLETYFGAGEIKNEEQTGFNISFILMGMLFNEGGDDVSLFKGICYKYPEQFFMIDLYAINAKTVKEDALAYQNMFYSINSL
jgi:hypothetical protein